MATVVFWLRIERLFFFYQISPKNIPEFLEKKRVESRPDLVILKGAFAINATLISSLVEGADSFEFILGETLDGIVHKKKLNVF